MIDERESAVVIATGNRGKLREYLALLPAGTRVLTLHEVGVALPEETGTSFAENAAMKALEASRQTSLLVIADDSGLEVDALDGRPGIRSARYAGEPVDDQRNRSLVLRQLEGFEPERRVARFRCAVAIARAGNILAEAEAICAGSISVRPRGEYGFGYDPIFLLPDGRTMAEVAPAEKNRISHRARAFARLAPEISRLLSRQRRDGDTLE